jgi:KipI family sensor histidine kinase inhibitor
LLIEFGDAIDYGINARVYALQRKIEASGINHAVEEFIPSYRSLLVEYDATEFSHHEMRDRISALIENAVSTAGSIVETSDEAIRIPVAYGGEYGPDLEVVADHAELSADDVISIHSGTDYHVFMLGFAPGFPYLGGMDERIACPRLATPRTLVPAGSVGIAETQTGVYPNASPGGWQLIGRTPMALFDVDVDPPAAMLPGNKVNFVPISHEEYEAQAKSE